MERNRTTGEEHPVSELLEDAGNCRHQINQELNLHPLSGSFFSEQQKLRHVLDWANRFLSNGSEVYTEYCRADSLALANEKNGKKRETDKRSPACRRPSAAKSHHPASSTAGSDEIFEGGKTGKVLQHKLVYYDDSEPPLQEDLHVSLSFTPRRETENLKSTELSTSKQTHSQKNCRTGGLHISNKRHQTNVSDSNTNQTFASDAATQQIKESTSCWSDEKLCNTSTVFGAVSDLKMFLQSSDSTDVIHKTAGAHSKEAMSENQKEMRKEAERTADVDKEEKSGTMTKEHESSSALGVNAHDDVKHNEKILGKLSQNFKIPTNVSVYEQYQLCVARLQHLKMRESQDKTSGCLIKSPANGQKTCEQSGASDGAPARPTSDFELSSPATNPSVKECVSKAGSKMVVVAEITEEKSLDVINKKQDRATNSRYTQTELCDRSTVKENRRLDQRITVNGKQHGDFMKTTAKDITDVDKVLFPKKSECHQGPKCHQSSIKVQKTTTVSRGPRRLREKSSVSLSSLQNGRTLPSRSHSAGPVTHTQRPTPEDRVKHTPLSKDTHTCLQPTETHTLHHDETKPTSSSSGTTANVVMNNTGWKYTPAGVPVCDRWLYLPDEVWLFILSLLPHRDLCRAAQVCSRLDTLATDQTFWKNLRIENVTLTEQWLLFVGKRRPRSLSLYSCSSLSVTSSALKMFFILCRDSLEEVKVTSCTGPGLHGDQMLSLIGESCDYMTSVDVSWSGATDTGVKALSDSHTQLRLTSVVLNGCHVTDDPLGKLVMRHKESLQRLEVFGCQFLTSPCLQTIYEMCCGLKHLNIGQLPKVNTHSLMVLASQLKCLISLNLTGLQAVTDSTVESLLQKCVELQSLTLSSCPGVTDQTLHNITKYTPCIRYRSLDVSGCKAVTDAGVQFLTLRCRRLQQLDLSSTGTKNKGVTLLGTYCSGQLHTIKLSFCHITSENILKLCRCCKRLKVLHLYGCADLPTEQEIREVNTNVKVYPVL